MWFYDNNVDKNQNFIRYHEMPIISKITVYYDNNRCHK